MTGLSALDEATGGLVRAGLTVLGAPCGTGKTTLCLNIADNLAKAGMDVLFFSLEMPRRELILKSLSSETLRLGAKEAVPVNELANNADSPAVKSALEAYSRYAGRVFMPGMTPTQDALEACVRRHIEATGNIPFVVVDYLQLLSPDGARAHLSDKQALDRVVYALKSLCRATGVTMLVVSSLNRQGYHDICMEAFKESGSIEYSSDLLLGLKCDGSRAEVKVLKHRYGEAGKSAALRFYAKYGCFV